VTPAPRHAGPVLPALLDTYAFEALLKKAARSFQLSLRILPKSIRPTLSLAYLLARASDTIADASTALGESYRKVGKYEEARALAARLRAARPGPDFTISLRTSWDGQDEAALKSRLRSYAEAGLDHVMVEPTDREMDGWLRSVEAIARAGGL
jgi:phytoene/squalene synthetase